MIILILFPALSLTSTPLVLEGELVVFVDQGGNLVTELRYYILHVFSFLVNGLDLLLGLLLYFCHLFKHISDEVVLFFSISVFVMQTSPMTLILFKLSLGPVLILLQLPDFVL